MNNLTNTSSYDTIELIVAKAILDRSDKIELIISLELAKIQSSIYSKL